MSSFSIQSTRRHASPKRTGKPTSHNKHEKKPKPHILGNTHRKYPKSWNSPLPQWKMDQAKD